MGSLSIFNMREKMSAQNLWGGFEEQTPVSVTCGDAAGVSNWLRDGNFTTANSAKRKKDIQPCYFWSSWDGPQSLMGTVACSRRLGSAVGDMRYEREWNWVCALKTYFFRLNCIWLKFWIIWGELGCAMMTERALYSKIDCKVVVLLLSK